MQYLTIDGAIPIPLYDQAKGKSFRNFYCRDDQIIKMFLDSTSPTRNNNSYDYYMFT